MRPINLIPAEEQRKNRGSGSRSGPLPLLLVGALALLLVGIVVLLHYSNQVSGREDNVEQLQVEKAEATTKAAELSSFTAFARVTEQRNSTIAELANARFDWARVIQQLSLILPPDVYFTSMNGSAGGGDGEASVVATGPSLSLAGCSDSQTAVAGFVATLKQIDGVTRVSLQSSVTSGGEGGEVSGASPCSAKGKLLFEILVVFDYAPPSPDGEVAPVEEEAPEGGEGESSSEGSSESESSEGETAPTQSASTSEGGAAG
jgi:Tfp pilus assembly protein PilN